MSRIAGSITSFTGPMLRPLDLDHPCPCEGAPAGALPRPVGALLLGPGARIYAWLLTVLAILIAWSSGAGVAHANRFGPPWQAVVTAESTLVYSQPDRAAPPVGPLPRGAMVVVLGEHKAGDGTEWTAILDGYVLSGEIQEYVEPWVAEVSVPSVSIHAKPDAKSDIRRTGREGDLLRVSGVSPGLDGDTGIWWATTEGFLPMRSLRGATGEWAAEWSLPSGAEAPRGWWGAIRSIANVRAGSTTDAPVLGQLAAGSRVKVLTEEEGEAVGRNAVWYRIDGGRFAGGRVHSSLVQRLPDPEPNLAPLPPEVMAEAWLVVDRSAATLTYIKDGQPRFVTYVSLGRAGVETPEGGYSTMGKYRFDDMTSSSVKDADRSYDLPNVPFIQYYRDGGYAIHGTYWHDNFGSTQSQGCVNLTWTDAAYLFFLTQPQVATGDNARWSPKEKATPVVIVG